MRVTYCDPGKARGLDVRRGGYCTTYKITDHGVANVPTKGPTPINQAVWAYTPGKIGLVKAIQLDAHVRDHNAARTLTLSKLSQLADRFSR